MSTLFTLGLSIGFGLGLWLSAWGLQRYRRWRDAQDLRIRDERLRKYNITPRIK